MPDTFIFCQSGKISPNLITLAVHNPCIEKDFSPIIIVVQRDAVKLHQDPGCDVSSFVRLEVARSLDNVAEARDPNHIIGVIVY